MKKKILLLFIYLSYALLTPLNTFAATNIPPPEGQNSYILQSTIGSYSSTIFGRVSGGYNAYVGFQFVPNASRYLCQVDVTVHKSGAPTDNIYANLMSGGTTLTNGTLLATSNQIAGSDIGTGTGGTILSFYFGTASSPGNCFGVSGSQNYWIQIKRSGSNSDTNYYHYDYNSGGTSSGGVCLLWGSTFGKYSPDAECGANIYGISDGSFLDISISPVTNVCTNNVLAGACSLLANLFIPSQTVASSSANTIKDLFLSKAPFGYINTALSIDLTDTNAASTSPTLTLPIGHTNDYISDLIPSSMVWADSSANNNAQTATNGFRTTFSLLLWLVFIFYIVFTIRRVF